MRKKGGLGDGRRRRRRGCGLDGGGVGLELDERSIGPFPGVDGRSVDGTEEGCDPLLEGAVLERKEGEGSAQEGKEDDKGPLNEAGERGGVDDEGDKGAAGKLEELLDGHIAYQAEGVGRDVLRYRVLFKHRDRT